MITGENGTGKSVVARMLHLDSDESGTNSAAVKATSASSQCSVTESSIKRGLLTRKTRESVLKIRAYEASKRGAAKKTGDGADGFSACQEAGSPPKRFTSV
jgi:hypothetical protein